jgi:hypothetical protein
MAVSFLDIAATVCFALAILHTFLVKPLQHIGHRALPGSVKENLFHLLGEVEVVFGLWAGFYVLILTLKDGVPGTIRFLEGLDFTEPVFVFVVMSVCSTRPVLAIAGRLIEFVSGLIPLPSGSAFYFTALTVGPLLGSFITEPAAMTVTALILLEHFYNRGVSEKFKYATLGLLFVNISIGGTLTPYAAPSVLMVASKRKWGLEFIMIHFGISQLLYFHSASKSVPIRKRQGILRFKLLTRTSNVDFVSSPSMLIHIAVASMASVRRWSKSKIPARST